MAAAPIISLLVIGSVVQQGSSETSSPCLTPRQPTNGKVLCVRDPAGILKCYATCNSGYSFQSASVEFLSCNESDGTWEKGDNFSECLVSNSKCQSLSPPRNGIVKCETVSSKLVCTARCNDKFNFQSGETTVKRECDPVLGWTAGKSIPDCIVDCNTQYVISSNDQLSDSDFMTSTVLVNNGHEFSPKKSDIFCVTPDCGWRPSSSDLNQFVQINLQSPRQILGIVTKGIKLNDSEIYVTRYRILHSMDGRVFVPYSDENVTDKFFSGNDDGTSPKLHQFSCPFTSQYIRINPLEWHVGIGFRFELLGCSKQAVPTGSPITTKVPQTLPGATVTTTSASGSTSKPLQKCSALQPPGDGAVNCQQTANELSCNAICNDGYQFASKQTVTQLTCNKQTGVWTNGTNFPACIRIQNTYTTVKPRNRNCVSSQSDCLVYGNGDYNTCGDCRYFATCSEGVVYIRACPNNLKFDAITGTCQFVSLSCRKQTEVPFG